MRLCTTVTSGFELSFTTVGSEPLLAEAAKEAMDKIGRSPVQHLSQFMDVNWINHGQQGKLVAALLIMQAYDAVAKSRDTRSIYVLDFLEMLLGGTLQNTLHNALPSFLHTKEEYSVLGEAFKDAKM
jgi:hypothetical protein